MADLPVPAASAPPAIADELKSARDYAAAEKADATRRAYAGDWQDFAGFCAARGVESLPAEPATLAAYAAALADAGRKYSTIRRRLAAIAYAHRLKGLTPPDQAEAVKAVLRGIRRSIGTAVTRKAPATVETLSRMLKKLPDTLTGKRDRALLLIGFAAALRRSELVDLKVNDLEFRAQGVIVHLRKSKTDQEGKGQLVAVPNGKRLKPVAALRDWLDCLQKIEVSESGKSEQKVSVCYVFRSIGKGGRIGARLSGRSVADIVKRFCARAGFDPKFFSGHSLRAGLVTTALERGEDPLNIMRITRHVEVSTLADYDRRAKAFDNHAGRKFL